MRILFVAVACALAVASCSRDIVRPDIFRTRPAYVPPTAYLGYSCRALADEAQRVSADAVLASGGEPYTGNSIAMYVGKAVFFPVLVFSRGNYRNSAELRRLNATMAAIEQANIQNNCGLSIQHIANMPPPPPPPPMSESEAPSASPPQAPLFRRGH